jgi:16S rRNA processing protein RimM
METNHPLFIELDGQRVPFFVEEVELISDNQAIIKFEYVETPEDAKKISGCPIYFDSRRAAGSPEIGEDLADLVGFSATDPASGLHGRITDYLSHPMNPVFLIQVEGKELMVPAVWNFIEHIDLKARTVRFNLPEGLTTL